MKAFKSRLTFLAIAASYQTRVESQSFLTEHLPVEHLESADHALYTMETRRFRTLVEELLASSQTPHHSRLLRGGSRGDDPDEVIDISEPGATEPIESAQAETNPVLTEPVATEPIAETAVDEPTAPAPDEPVDPVTQPTEGEVAEQPTAEATATRGGATTPTREQIQADDPPAEEEPSDTWWSFDFGTGEIHGFDMNTNTDVEDNTEPTDLYDPEDLPDYPLTDTEDLPAEEPYADILDCEATPEAKGCTVKSVKTPRTVKEPTVKEPSCKKSDPDCP